MRLCIHRGTHEIGGTCVELESSGQRILLDLGLPLTAEDAAPELLPAVAGLAKATPSLLGIVISHGHRDHWGLLPAIRVDLPVLLGEATHRILAASAPFIRGTIVPKAVRFMHDRQAVTLGPFRITPLLVDHSAYDAYGLLIEAGEKRVLYSGDLRSHGRKGRLFERLVSNRLANIDVMLMEGTLIGRSEVNGLTEATLEDALVYEFKQTKGAVLVFASAQNVDRMVSIYRACKRTQRHLVLDLYAAEILRATENPNVPQTSWSDVHMFVPQSQRRKIKTGKLFEILKRHHHYRIYPGQLGSMAYRIVLCCRAAMLHDLRRTNLLSEARAIWSQWDGYLKKPDGEMLRGTLDCDGVPLKTIHASGHAGVRDLRRLAAAVAPKALVPIHTSRPESYREMFENVRVCQDGEWWNA